MVSEKLFSKYNIAVQKALKDEERKAFFTRIGHRLRQQVFKNKKYTVDELKEELPKVVKEQLELSDVVSATFNGNEFTFSVRGCAICPSNDILRKENIEPACPIVPMVRSLIGSCSDVSEVEIKENQKPKVGDCNQIYLVKSL